MLSNATLSATYHFLVICGSFGWLHDADVCETLSPFIALLSFLHLSFNRRHTRALCGIASSVTESDFQSSRPNRRTETLQRTALHLAVYQQKSVTTFTNRHSKTTLYDRLAKAIKHPRYYAPAPRYNRRPVVPLGQITYVIILSAHHCITP